MIFTTYAAFMIHMVRSEDSEKGSDAGDGGEQAAMYDDFEYTASNGPLGAYWSQNYKIIYQCNEILDDIEKSENKDDTENIRTKGEALFFRAYCYFNLVRAFGEVPLVTIKVVEASAVGYMIPQEYASRIKYLREHTEGIENVILSCHMHNDLGMAVANSLAGVEAGIDQIECTINGIGERAGNASMEECVMALKTRADHFGIGCNIETTQIYRASRMIQTITGVAVAPTKPIVGANAFAHEAGIHQHGVMANKETYEIMTPESVGIPKNAIVLGKHSGRHAFEERLHELGYTLDHEKLEKAFEKFKILADKKKVIKDRDLEGLIGP